jgi:hypothetical protein
MNYSHGLDGTSKRQSAEAINKARNIGRVLGAMEQYQFYSNSQLVIDAFLKDGKWKIVAQYDKLSYHQYKDPSRIPRDSEAEITFYCHAADMAPFARAVVLDTRGRVLAPLD